MQKDDFYIKYKNQLDIVQNQVNQSKKEASDLKEKSLKLFMQLKEESYQRLQLFEQTVNIPMQLPNYDIDMYKVANSTFQQSIDEAERLLKSKLEKPMREIEKLKEQIQDIETENSGTESVHKVQSLNAEKNKMKDDYEVALNQIIKKEMLIKDHIAHLYQSLENEFIYLNKDLKHTDLVLSKQKTVKLNKVKEQMDKFEENYLDLKQEIDKLLNSKDVISFRNEINQMSKKLKKSLVNYWDTIVKDEISRLTSIKDTQN